MEERERAYLKNQIDEIIMADDEVQEEEAVEEQVVDGDVAGNVQRVKMFGSKNNMAKAPKPWTGDDLKVLVRCMRTNSKSFKPGTIMCIR